MAAGRRIALTHPLDGGGVVPIKHLGAPIDPDDAARLEDIDHEVKADAVDVGHGSLDDKIITIDGITKSIVVEDGKRKLRLGYTAPSPTAVASTLYPAFVNLLYRGEAVGLLRHAEGGSSLTPAGGVSTWYVGQTPMQLYVTDASGGMTIAVHDGDLVGYWLPGLVSDSPTRVHLGLYVVVDCGYHVVPTPGHPEIPFGISTVPIIARVLNANTPDGLCYGSIWSIAADGGAEYAGYSFTLATADPIEVDVTLLDFTAVADYVPAGTHKLLTGPQLVSEHASQSTILTSATGIGDVDMDGFETLVGFPNLGYMPAGFWEFYNEHVWLEQLFPGSPGSVTTLRWRILRDPGAVELFVAESQPITTVPMVVRYQFFDAGRVFSSAYRWVAVPSMHTNSTTPVIMYFSYGNAITRITVPFSLPIEGAGDGDHQHLMNRYQDVVALDPAKREACHPADAIGAGRLHRNVGVGTILGGILTLPDDASQCRVSLEPGTTSIVGITTTRFSDGDSIMIHFSNASMNYKVNIANMGDVSSYPTAAPLNLQTASSSAMGLSIFMPTMVCFWLDAEQACWRLDRKSATS